MSSFPVPLDSLTTLVDDDLYESAWRPEILSAPTFLLEIDLQGVHSTDDLFKRVTAGLGFEPDDAVDNWSVFQDMLWQQVADHSSDSGAIVLRHAEDMAAFSLGDLLETVSVCTGLAKTVRQSSETSFPRVVALYVILTGAGPSFPDEAE